MINTKDINGQLGRVWEIVIILIRDVIPACIIFCLSLISLVPYIFVPSNSEVHSDAVYLSTSVSNSTAYSTYRNSELGVGFNYPLEWQKIEFAGGIVLNGRNILANFVSPPEGSSDNFRGYIVFGVSDYQDGFLLSDYVKKQIGEYEKTYQGFKVIRPPPVLQPETAYNRSYNTKDGRLPDPNLEFTYEDPNIGLVKVVEWYFQGNHRVYALSLHSEAANYENYLRIISKMLKSFRIM